MTNGIAVPSVGFEPRNHVLQVLFGACAREQESVWIVTPESTVLPRTGHWGMESLVVEL